MMAKIYEKQTNLLSKGSESDKTQCVCDIPLGNSSMNVRKAVFYKQKRILGTLLDLSGPIQ